MSCHERKPASPLPGVRTAVSSQWIVALHRDCVNGTKVWSGPARALALKAAPIEDLETMRAIMKKYSLSARELAESEFSMPEQIPGP